MPEIEKLKAEIKQLKKENKQLRNRYVKPRNNILSLSFSAIKQAFDSIDAIVYVANITTYELLYLNKKGIEIFGDYKDKLCWQVMQRSLKNPCSFCINDQSSQKKIIQREFLNPFDNKWYKSFDIFLNWENNQAVKLEIASDITKIKELEILEKQNNIKLKESSLKYKTLFDTLPYPALIIEDNKVIQANNEALKFIEYKNENSIVGKPVSSFLRVNNTNIDLNQILNIFQSENFNTDIFEIEVKNKNNILKNAEITGTHFFEKGNKKTLIVLNNITYRKKNEQKLKNLIATKDKFFSIIAHDLKNPFNQIMGFLDLLSENAESYDKQQVQKIVQYLISSANNGYKLLENLLEWSRSQTGNIKFIPQKLDINHLIFEKLEFFKNNAQQKNINFKFTQNQQRIYVLADKDMMKTVLRNIISNALKYTFQGGEISVNLRKKGNYIIVSVKDNGIGIPESKLDNLFKIDKTNSTPGTNNEQGTGLGLIICKEFVEKNGGEITVDSETGIGTTFNFTIPIF